MPRVPEGFPLVFKGPAVWTSDDITSDEQYVILLEPLEVFTVENALRSFQASKIGIDHVNRENFPLSADLAAKLKSISKILHKGRGFAVLRGLQPSNYTDEENVIIYGGLSCYVAKERADMIHIYDRVGGDQGESSGARFPPNELTTQMNFHTDVDAGDILSLFTLSLPLSGGQQHLVSFPTVYNTLSVHHPDVLQTLAQPWRYEMPHPSGPRIIERSIISYREPNLQVNFATAFLIGSGYVPRLASSPELSAEQKHAISTFLDVCKRHSLSITQKKGDILFVNNMSTLHARDDFIDGPGPGEQRHLLSMMLRDPPLAWEKPQDVAQYIDERFTKLNIPDFFGTVRQYEAFRDKYAMLRHD